MANKKPTKADLEAQLKELSSEVADCHDTIIRANEKILDLEREAQTLRVANKDYEEEVGSLRIQLDFEKQARVGLYGFGVVVLIAVGYLIFS